jgi:hypothetical protein
MNYINANTLNGVITISDGEGTYISNGSISSNYVGSNYLTDLSGSFITGGSVSSNSLTSELGNFTSGIGLVTCNELIVGGYLISPTGLTAGFSITGPTGATGLQGATGIGQTGATGPAPVFSIYETTTLQPTQPAYVSINNTNLYNPSLSFGVPMGYMGAAGLNGTTYNIGTTTTLTPGSSAYVTVDASNNLNFGIPAGVTTIDSSSTVVVPTFSVYQTNTVPYGTPCCVSINNDISMNPQFTFNIEEGEPAPLNSFSVLETYTVSSSTPASVVVTDISSNEFGLYFYIPQGVQGAQGPQGSQGPQGERGKKGDTGAAGQNADSGTITAISTAVATSVSSTVSTSIATSVATSLIETFQAKVEAQLTAIDAEIASLNTEVTTLNTDVDTLQVQTQNLSATLNSSTFTGALGSSSLNVTNAINSASLYSSTISSNSLTSASIKTDNITSDLSSNLVIGVTGTNTSLTLSAPTVYLGSSGNVSVEGDTISCGNIENFGTINSNAISCNNYYFTSNVGEQSMNIATNSVGSLLSSNYITIGSGVDIITFNGRVIFNFGADSSVSMPNFISQFR